VEDFLGKYYNFAKKNIQVLKRQANRKSKEAARFADDNFLRFVSGKRILFLLFIGSLLFFRTYICNQVQVGDSQTGTEAALANYKKDVLIAAKLYDIPPSYLMALIMIESSGRKDVPARFEKKVYQKLQDLQSGKISKFENLTTESVKNASDGALRNLASSWGPFQLMGYKCTFLDVKLKEMRGKNAIYLGAKWIDTSYGNYLKKKKFKDAFHLHNTGREYPKSGKPFTHDPNYVSEGIKYMNFFSYLDDEI